MNKVMTTSSLVDAFPSLAIAITLMLLIWSPVAMFIGAAIGLAGFVLLYKQQLRSAGWLRTAIAAAVSAALAATLAIALSLR